MPDNKLNPLALEQVPLEDDQITWWAKVWKMFDCSLPQLDWLLDFVVGLCVSISFIAVGLAVILTVGVKNAVFILPHLTRSSDSIKLKFKMLFRSWKFWGWVQFHCTVAKAMLFAWYGLMTGISVRFPEQEIVIFCLMIVGAFLTSLATHLTSFLHFYWSFFSIFFFAGRIGFWIQEGHKRSEEITVFVALILICPSSWFGRIRASGYIPFPNMNGANPLRSFDHRHAFHFVGPPHYRYRSSFRRYCLAVLGEGWLVTPTDFSLLCLEISHIILGFISEPVDCYYRDHDIHIVGKYDALFVLRMVSLAVIIVLTWVKDHFCAERHNYWILTYVSIATPTLVLMQYEYSLEADMNLGWIPVCCGLILCGMIYAYNGAPPKRGTEEVGGCRPKNARYCGPVQGKGGMETQQFAPGPVVQDDQVRIQENDLDAQPASGTLLKTAASRGRDTRE